MVKSELIESIAEKANLSLGKAETIVDTFFDTTVEALSSGQRVEIRGFGAFSVRDYKAYEGRNPRTGDKVYVAPKRMPFWTTGLALRRRVDEGRGLKLVGGQPR